MQNQDRKPDWQRDKVVHRSTWSNSDQPGFAGFLLSPCGVTGGEGLPRPRRQETDRRSSYLASCCPFGHELAWESPTPVVSEARGGRGGRMS